MANKKRTNQVLFQFVYFKCPGLESQVFGFVDKIIHVCCYFAIKFDSAKQLGENGSDFRTNPGLTERGKYQLRSLLVEVRWVAVTNLHSHTSLLRKAGA